MTVGKPNIDRSILNPRHKYKTDRHGTSISYEPPADVERRPQGTTCIACGRAGCGGHPKAEY